MGRGRQFIILFPLNFKYFCKKIKMEKIIPGIYLYCNRWCEMCPFTVRCEAFGADKSFHNGEHDEKMKQFWQDLESGIAENEERIVALAAEKGISLSEFDEPTQKKDFDLFQKGAKSNLILKAGRDYEDLVDDWFDKALEEYGLAMVETKNGAMPKLDTILPGNEKANQMFEIVLRFQLQVYLKLSRMFYSKGREGAELEEGVEADNPNAVGKTTLETLKRSFAAWSVIAEKYPEDKMIFEILILILRLKNNIIAEFPETEKFERLGLDG